MTYLVLVWLTAAAPVAAVAYCLGRAAGLREAIESLERAIERMGRNRTPRA